MAAFIVGLLTAFGIGLIVRILIGLRLKLYLLNRESPLEDQNIIPVTNEIRKASIWRTLIKRRWRENVEVELHDHKDSTFRFQFSYHLLLRYYMVCVQRESQALLDGKPIETKKIYLVRTGMVLKLGDRRFVVMVSPNSTHQELFRETVQDEPGMSI